MRGAGKRLIPQAKIMRPMVKQRITKGRGSTPIAVHPAMIASENWFHDVRETIPAELIKEKINPIIDKILAIS